MFVAFMNNIQFRLFQYKSIFFQFQNKLAQKVRSKMERDGEAMRMKGSERQREWERETKTVKQKKKQRDCTMHKREREKDSE